MLLKKYFLPPCHVVSRVQIHQANEMKALLTVRYTNSTAIGFLFLALINLYSTHLEQLYLYCYTYSINYIMKYLAIYYVSLSNIQKETEPFTQRYFYAIVDGCCRVVLDWIK